MRPTNAAVLAAVLAVSPVLSAVAAQAAEAGADRYRLEKSAEGYVRMDTLTGAMSLCEEKSGQLVCRMAADERAALQDEIGRVQGSVEALEERVARLEKAPPARLDSTLPSEEEFDKTMGYMERFFRTFLNIVKDFSREDGDAAKPAPDRT